MFKNIVNAASFEVGKESYRNSIKTVKLTWEFEEALEGCALSNIDPSGLEKCELM